MGNLTRRFLHTLAATLVVGTAVAQQAAKEVQQQLRETGFEEIRLEAVRMLEGDSIVTCTVERGLETSPGKDFRKALDLLSSHYPATTTIRIVMLEQGQATYVLESAGSAVSVQNSDEQTDGSSQRAFELNYADGTYFKRIEWQKPLRSVHSGVTFTIFPQLRLQNTYYDKIYEVQFNLAPALEYSPWRGMLLTGQMLFPLYNDLDYAGDYIRPGFLTARQQFNLPHLNRIALTVGNFNQSRYGADLKWYKFFQNSPWSVRAQIGLTGHSNVKNWYWDHSSVEDLSWNVRASYYLSRYNLRADVQAGRYFAGDYGTRVDLTRHFGQVSVGFYASYAGGDANGGFHVAIPIDPFRHRHQHAVRVMVAPYFDQEYTLEGALTTARYYETSPRENRSEMDLYPQYIDYLINKSKTK
ncbi:YjbH domain-containing protein [Mangrovibacterium diazotrophicum]|uniref:Exopolysaccharide biosynthesis protein YbjH n=1 Tax=Mangrovibacterium diazotrophicum TaxID=1261403 RepID=A0A419W966_9BACT|nr:YjbH domain-containing protein [Mangrovibacterium diazotrophicum]RKD91989.1 exopolysaccharide biosynthesis protein YbjH [Mangrovibacterium diazotrophicum]